MSFWNTSDNKAVDTSGKFEASASMEPIPDGTNVLAAPVEAGWKSYEGEDYINIQWQVLAPVEFKNRRFFQKIKVYEPDAAKADKAKRMLAAIDANAGGKLIALGKEPNDAQLTQSLVGKQMVIKLGVWEINNKTGNWVMAVSPKQGAQAPVQQPRTPTEAMIDEDIPF
jgi:hypothetical protein